MSSWNTVWIKTCFNVIKVRGKYSCWLRYVVCLAVELIRSYSLQTVRLVHSKTLGLELHFACTQAKYTLELVVPSCKQSMPCKLDSVVSLSKWSITLRHGPHCACTQAYCEIWMQLCLHASKVVPSRK